MDNRGDLVSAVEDTHVRGDSHPYGSQSRGEIPLRPRSRRSSVPRSPIASCSER